MTKSAKRKQLWSSRVARREQQIQRRRRRAQLIGGLLVVALSLGLQPQNAIGDGVGVVLTSKSLPAATVAVIDPESGTSSGGSGSDVNLAVGDIILFRFAFAPVPNAAVHGQVGYLTEYVPPGTDVVGVRLIDENGLTIEPNRAGLARDGCHNNNTCEFGSGTTIDCSNGRCVEDIPVDTLPEGSIAQLIADTGIFFSTDTRTERTPNTEFLNTNNGINMSTDLPLDITRVNGLIGDDSAPFFAHNEWDWQQVQAFGPEGGNTPHLVGSPVAGPDTHYSFEATDVNGTIEFNDVVGPWERIVYPGSQTGLGDGNAEGAFGAGSLEAARPSQATSAGWDVTPAAADVGTQSGRIEGANAVRFAFGEARTGRPMFAEIALRVNSVPIDPNFIDPLLGTGGNVDCAEVFGSDLSGNIPQDGRGQNNSWALYMGSPTCVFLRNKFDLNVDKDIATNGDQLTFTLDGSNLALTDETNVTACIKFDSSGLSYNPAIGERVPDSQICTAAACGDTSALGGCLIYNLGDLAPGADYNFDATFDINGGNGKDALTTQAVYASTELPIDTGTLAGGFTTQALAVVTAVPLPKIATSVNYDQTVTFSDAGGTATIVGTLSNEGTRAFGPSDFMVHLPANWTVTSSDADATPDVTIDGAILECTTDCTGEDPIFGFAGSAADVAPAGTVGDSQTITFTVNIPGGEATALHTIDLAVNSASTSFGPNFEVLFPKAVTVNVGAVRSVAPTIDCPVGSTAQSITGLTTEGVPEDTNIRTYFNLIERGDANAIADGTWSVTNYDGATCDNVTGRCFGGMYGGLEIRATAQANGELESELSAACEVTPQRECSDGIDNDGDGDTDFPADIGCDSPTDNDETDPALPECSDGIDNDGDGVADYAGTTSNATDPDLAFDNGCSGPDDNTEDDTTACADTIDNDGDGLTDLADPGCLGDAASPTEIDLAQCQNYIDDDGDGSIDFAGLDQDVNGTVEVAPDLDCISAFDDDESAEPVSTDIKARLLLVMDTSGSMNFNTCNPTFTGGDGSTECPGDDVLADVCDSDTDSNGLPDDSRMAKVKSGISDVVSGYGEVEYGLMRFAQRAEDFSCPTQAASLRSGGWQGGGEPPCDGGFNQGELLVGFGESQNEILQYLDGEANYPSLNPPAGMDHELRGSGTTPIGGSLSSANDLLTQVATADSAGACRPYSVVLVTDGGETCDGDPVAQATALELAGFDVYVIGFATSDQTIIDGLDDIAAAGGTGSAIVVDDSAALSQAMADIITSTILTETCNGADDDCDCPGDTNGDGTICGPGDVGVDEDFPNIGDTCNNGQNTQCFREGTFVCTADELGTECNAPTIAPGTEECNGQDDDCDLLVDEDFGAECTCIPTLEICNGVDDDCDTFTDEDTGAEPLPGVGQACGLSEGICSPGTLACTAGNFDCVGVTDPELEDDIDTDCDGLDNDCDTVVDEVTVICFDPDDDPNTVDAGCDLATGICLGTCQTGLRSCLANGAGPGSCDNDIGPALEVCNGQDDDCDDIIDNGFPVGDACDNDQLGECLVTGTLICDPNDNEGDGDFVQCTAFPVPVGVEVCNGLDDDCDGEIDEDTAADPLPAPIGNSCGGTGTACNAGTITCVNGAPTCEGVVGGSDETCNGLDDDCDNLIDEDNAAQPLLGIGEQCYPFATGCDIDTDTCLGSCGFGATICIDGAAVCDGATGPAVEETCNGEDDDCDGLIDEAASCPVASDVCFEGECVGACGPGEFPCPLDFFCQNIPDVGDYCTSDPCVDLECDATEECDSLAGECFDPCDTTNCPTGTECLLGECFDCFDAGFECAEDENCQIADNPGVGECVPDLCFNTQCQDDQFCRDGDCIDLTCDPACGSGEVCSEGACVADLCEDVDCGNRLCNPTSGECVDDVCENKFCPQGTACNPGSGECISDPCLALDCPADLVCEISFEGTGQCVSPVIPPPPGEWVAAGGGGGCSTSGSNRSGMGGFLLLLVAGLVLRRRRR